MKWFKHISDSLNDPDISSLLEEFGSDGYLVFFGVLELMSKEFDENNPGVSTFSYKFLTKNLQISRRKLTKILQKTTEKNRIIAVFDNNYLTLKCDKLKELCDNWTQAKLRSNFEVKKKKLNSKELEEELDKEVEEENEKKKPLKEKLKKYQYQRPGTRAYKEFVWLNDYEYERLIEKYGEKIVNIYIEILDEYIGSRGLQSKYKDHNRTLHGFIRRYIEKTGEDEDSIMEIGGMRGLAEWSKEKGVIK